MSAHIGSMGRDPASVAWGLMVIFALPGSA